MSGITIQRIRVGRFKSLAFVSTTLVKISALGLIYQRVKLNRLFGQVQTRDLSVYARREVRGKMCWLGFLTGLLRRSRGLAAI